MILFHNFRVIIIFTQRGLAEAMVGAVIIPKEGVMGHLEDDTAKDFCNAPLHLWLDAQSHFIHL